MTLFLAPLAAMAAATSAAATPGSDWATLDKELEGLAGELRSADAGPVWSGFLRTTYAVSSENAVDSNGDDVVDAEFAGFTLENVRLAVNGETAGYTYCVSFDFGGLEPGPQLRDAWIGVKAWGAATVYVGSMRAPFLRTALLPESTNLFVLRTRNGFLWTTRDTGLRVDNDFGGVRLRLGQQNGDDGTGDKLRSTARLEWDVMGGAASQVEGAYGAPEGPRLNLGAAITNDAALEGDELALAVDAVATWGSAWGGFALQAELVNYGDGYDTLADPNAALDLEGDTTPWSLTGSWTFMEGWEAALRWEDYDESVFQREVLTIGVNKYVSGHDLKWQANWISIDGVEAAQNDFIAVGATLAF